MRLILVQCRAVTSDHDSQPLRAETTSNEATPTAVQLSKVLSMLPSALQGRPAATPTPPLAAEGTLAALLVRLPLEECLRRVDRWSHGHVPSRIITLARTLQLPPPPEQPAPCTPVVATHTTASEARSEEGTLFGCLFDDDTDATASPARPSSVAATAASPVRLAPIATATAAAPSLLRKALETTHWLLRHGCASVPVAGVGNSGPYRSCSKSFALCRDHPN